MSSDVNTKATQIGLHSFKLTQKRYEHGSFYLSLIIDGEEVKAFDGRFYLEDGNKLTPTKRGFRIPLEKLDEFYTALSGDLREIGDLILFENKSFKFHVRYLNDKYGEGIDIRKYKTTKKYSGWDKSGIRMKLEDVEAVHRWLTDFEHTDVDPSMNIFFGKEISGKNKASEKAKRSAKPGVNPILKDILDLN
jgi:hypothetical protein